MAVARLVYDNNSLYVTIKGVVTPEFTDFLNENFGVYRFSAYRGTITISIPRRLNKLSDQEWDDRTAILAERVTGFFGSDAQQEYKSVVVFNKSDKVKANGFALAVNLLRGCYAVPSITGELIEFFCFGDDARAGAIEVMKSCFGEFAQARKLMADKTFYLFR